MTDQAGLLQDATPEELQRFLDEDASLPESQRRWPQELAALLRVMETTLVRLGVDSARAFALAAAQAADLAIYRGGRLLYLPQGQRLKLALRDAEIWRQFTGRNHQELADAHGLALQSIYEILREQRALNMDRRRQQGQLFERTGEQ